VADSNRALVGRILLLSAAFLGVIALVLWAGAFTIDPRMREVFTVGLALCALAEALIGLFFLMRS
jgi:hypothetical protein